MSQDKKKDSESEPEKINPPPTNTPNSNGADSVNHNQSPNSPNQHPRRHQKVKKEYWLLNKENQPVIANIISLFMMVATVALVIYTVGILNQTTSAANSTEKAAVATKQSADLQKQALNSQIAAKKQSDIADAQKLKRDTDFINKQKTGIDAQIDAFKETQKEFEIENKPFFQNVDFKIENIKVGEKPFISYNLKNYRKQPAKLIKDTYQIWYWEADKKTPRFNKSQNQTISLSAYLGEGVIYQQQRTMRAPTSAVDSILIKTGVMVFYLDGTLYFRNTVTDAISAYSYTYRIGYIAGKPNSYGIRDTTIEISPKKNFIKY